MDSFLQGAEGTSPTLSALTVQQTPLPSHPVSQGTPTTLQTTTIPPPTRLTPLRTLQCILLQVASLHTTPDTRESCDTRCTF